MINYDSSSSPFNEINRDYCQNIEAQFKEINVNCDGFCNSYGFEFKAKMFKDQKEYNFVFNKHQTTQNGVVIPINANECIYTHITIEGIETNMNLSIGRSYFRRLFTSNEYKNLLPAPYYFKSKSTIDNAFINEINKIVNESNLYKLNLCDKKLVCKLDSAIAHPIEFVNNLEKLINKL